MLCPCALIVAVTGMERPRHGNRKGDFGHRLSIVIAGLVPAIPIRVARPCRDGAPRARGDPDKPGHDELLRGKPRK